MTHFHMLMVGALLCLVVLAITDEWPPSDGEDGPWFL